MARKSGSSWEFALTQPQLNSMWHQCQDLVNRVLVGLCGFCGLRIGEAIHLNLDWIRQEEIHIPSRMPCLCWYCMNRKKEPGIWIPKTPAGVREVPITPEFFKPVLHEFLRSQPEGLKISRMAAYNRIARLGREAKIPQKVFPHSLRATYATICSENGMGVVAICYLIGDKRIEVVQHYIEKIRIKPLAKQQVKQIFQ